MEFKKFLSFVHRHIIVLEAIFVYPLPHIETIKHDRDIETYMDLFKRTYDRSRCIPLLPFNDMNQLYDLLHTRLIDSLTRTRELR